MEGLFPGSNTETHLLNPWGHTTKRGGKNLATGKAEHEVTQINSKLNTK